MSYLDKQTPSAFYPLSQEPNSGFSSNTQFWEGKFSHGKCAGCAVLFQFLRDIKKRWIYKRNAFWKKDDGT